MKFCDPQQVTALRAALADKLEDVELRLTRRRWPRIVVNDVPNEIPNDEMVDCRAKGCENSQLVPRFTFNGKQRLAQNQLLDVHPLIWKTVQGLKKLKLEWQIVRVRKYLRPTHCFKCASSMQANGTLP